MNAVESAAFLASHPELQLPDEAIKALDDEFEFERQEGREIAGRWLTPIEKLAKNPRSKSLAIAGKCWDCQGSGYDPGGRSAIRHCEITDCALWHHRPYRPKQA